MRKDDHCISFLALALCGSLLAFPAVSQQQDAPRKGGMSEAERKAAVERLRENFRRDVEKARSGNCTPGVTSDGNPTDRYCKMVYDHDFVIQAIDTPSPTPKVWRRLNELISGWDVSLTARTREDILAHLNGKPKPTDADLRALVQQTREAMFPMKGGTFIMGDYGWLEDPAYPVSGNKEDDNPFPVKLSDFLIQKQRVTLAEYDTYTRHQGLPLVYAEKHDWELRYPDYTARVTWQQAHDYCGWLAEISGQPFALPSEAQWEYSARSGGKEYAFGIAKRADEVDPMAFEKELEEIAGDHSGPDDLVNRPSGLYGPNPIGLYDFMGYGEEWVNDWYAPYPAPAPKRPVRDPTGPTTGVEKVARDAANGNTSELTITRNAFGKDYQLLDDGNHWGSMTNRIAFRCVLNAPRWK